MKYKDWYKKLRKGDCIVCQKGNGTNYLKDYIYKLRDYKIPPGPHENVFETELDSQGSTENGWQIGDFNNPNFRKATEYETKLYEQYGKPVHKNTVFFEVDSWYKINNCFYAKFKTIHGSETYWQYSEVINVFGNYKKATRNLQYIWEEYPMKLVTDLSEIQQYLPEGHPDKFLTKDDLVEGEIYRYRYGNYYTVGKCSSNKSLLFYYGMGAKEFGYDNIFWKEDGNFGASIYQTLATQEEKTWLNACIKANKFIPKKEALNQNKPNDNLPTDEELLEYANKHFIVGTRFISKISDYGRERECKYYYTGLKQKSFGWKVIKKDTGREVYCDYGMYPYDIDDKGVCSNPRIYSDKDGWCEITYDASITYWAHSGLHEEFDESVAVGTIYIQSDSTTCSGTRIDSVENKPTITVSKYKGRFKPNYPKQRKLPKKY